MILLCSGQISARHFDALVLFANKLDQAGLAVAIDDRFVPEELSKYQKYESAPFLTEATSQDIACVIVLGADSLSDEVLALLRYAGTGNKVRYVALGYFSDRQQEIGSCNRIAYSTGTEPEILNLAAAHTPQLIEAPVLPLVTPLSAAPLQSEGDKDRVLVYLPAEMLEDDDVLSDLAALSYAGRTELHVLTTAHGKDIIRKSRHSTMSVFGYSELPPVNLLAYADIFAFLGPNVPGERMASLALDAMGSGKVVLDCTESSALISAGAPALRAPRTLRALMSHLKDTIQPSRLEIGRRMLVSPWLSQNDLALLLSAAELKPEEDNPKATERGRSLFFPTNGNGLGHAQRCVQIAHAMPAGDNIAFAAFSSCTDMIRRQGFACTPMISRSDDHIDEYANDVMNYLRLRGMLTRADQLVFDGGYVFDSVYRVISSLAIPAVWVRRGLWRAEQVHSTALERERAFSMVITPEEAFPELNSSYSDRLQVHAVGPVVQTADADPDAALGLRQKLAKKFGREFRTLAVTMLGGGVASERTAQTQVLCNYFEQRADCLHLVVVWPHAVVAAGLSGWKNTKVIHTSHALALCQAADVTVSAVGYNSFHELIYAGIPAILIPQSAPYLDDQEKRARAAADRGLARLVSETALLQLEREVTAVLDGTAADDMRAALADIQLPEPGNKAAADLISKGLAS